MFQYRRESVQFLTCPYKGKPSHRQWLTEAMVSRLSGWKAPTLSAALVWPPGRAALVWPPGTSRVSPSRGSVSLAVADDAADAHVHPKLTTHEATVGS